MKVCSRCLRNKSLDDFHADVRYRLGVTGWCRDCKNARGRERSAEVKLEPKPPIRSKQCRACGKTKLVIEFPISASKKDGFGSRCKSCRCQIEAIPRMTSDRHKKNHLWGHYRMTIPDMREMMDAQQHRCALCRGKWSRPTRDHDHATGAVRGLLCFKCNSQLRAVEDGEFVKLALGYLEHHRNATPKFFATKYAENTRRRQKREEALKRLA